MYNIEIPDFCQKFIFLSVKHELCDLNSAASILARVNNGHVILLRKGGSYYFQHILLCYLCTDFGPGTQPEGVKGKITTISAKVIDFGVDLGKN